ncbi:MAG TPA: methyltransferase domain-containing protein [Ktedonobacterales bacterium]
MPGSVSFDRVADRYDATRGYPSEVAAQIAAGLIAAGDLAPGASLLEVGIGTGRIALPLLAAGINVTGVDISARMVERLRAKYAEQRERLPALPWGALRVEMADVTALPFADAAFDAVLGVHVLHLIPEWRAALDEALRVLRPGGVFLLGQDMTNGGERHLLNDRWEAIVRELGGTTGAVGAAGYRAAVAELRARGMHVDERVLARWDEPVTPREGLANITERLWSRTWQVPDDIFAESVRRLTTWADETFGDTLDTPVLIPLHFTVAVARRA